MNELIRKFWYQSVQPYTGDSWSEQTEFMERFAELIVRECMRMCDVAAIGYESHGHMKEANGCYSAKEYIEEHFGVEV